MGRTITINLTDAQRAELERGYREGATHGFRQRCHMVLLKADTRTSEEVATIVDVCARTVNTWLWRYKRIGITGLHTQPGQGRVPILDTTADVAAVRRAVADHRQPCRRHASSWKTS